MTHQPALIYEFGDFSVDAAKRQLRGRGGVTVPLTTKAFETLLYLVGRGGTVLEKDELLGAIWPDAIVEENNLTQAISSLRRALGESLGGREIIVRPVTSVRKYVERFKHAETKVPCRYYSRRLYRP